jgi:hypothetical protein
MIGNLGAQAARVHRRTAAAWRLHEQLAQDLSTEFPLATNLVHIAANFFDDSIA